MCFCLDIKVNRMKKMNYTKCLIALIGACFVASAAKAAAPPEAQGRITVRWYDVPGSNNISRLTDYAGYPDSPDAVYYPIHFEWPTGPTGLDEDSTEAPPGNVLDNYGWEIRGYYHPDRTGEHFFAIASDDPGELWLSTDDSFDNLEKIANEPTWNGVRNFGTEDRRSYVDEGTNDERLENWSKGIQLQKGQAYAIMARCVEGGGGDNLAVTHSNELFFENGMEPIDGSYLSTFDRSSLAAPSLKGVAAAANSITITLKDGEGLGATNVDQDSVSATLNGNAIELNVSKDGAATTATHTVTGSFLPSLSEHDVEVIFKDSAGTEYKIAKTVSVGQYGLVPASLALSNVDTSEKGFLFRTVQSAEGLSNNTDLRERHLAGEVGGENIADDWGSDDYVWTVELINFDQDGNPQGEFRDSGNGDSQDVPDDFIPGIPGLEGGTDNITGEMNTVVRIPAPGMYVFGFNSDDGFKTTVGNDAADSVYLGGFNGGRGASTTPFNVAFEAAGDYAMRSIWYEGGGGANLEWFTISPNKALLNDTANGGLVTFATMPSLPAKVTGVTPSSGASGVSPQSNITVTIEDGSATVDSSSVSISINGADAEVSVSKAGGVTTAEVDRSAVGLWPAGAQMTATLSYTAGGSTREVSWPFTVATYGTLSKARTDVGTGGEAGFEWRVMQSVQGRGNDTPSAEQHLAGGHDGGINNADTLGGGKESTDPDRPGIIFNLDGVINFDQDGNPQGVFRDSGDGSTTDRVDDFIPGIPGIEGSTDNITAEILSYIEFPAAGYYTMIFNSDDGFLVSETHGAGDDRGTTLGVFSGGRGAADTIFGFAVAEPGLYPIRAIWYEGGGGANLEWSSIVNGDRVLINDTSAGGLKAYRTRSGTPADVEVGGGDGAISSVALADGSVVIEYTGTLKSATSVTGPYSDVAGASSPYSVAPTKAAEFYIAE